MFDYKAILRWYDPSERATETAAEPTALETRDEEALLSMWREHYGALRARFGKNNPLLRRLDEALFPGFTTRKRPGPTKVWDDALKLSLRVAVDEYVAQRAQTGSRLSITRACQLLARRDEWAVKLRKASRNARPNPGEALRAHYNTADAYWADAVVGIRQSVAQAIRDPASSREISAVIRHPERPAAEKQSAQRL